MDFNMRLFVLILMTFFMFNAFAFHHNEVQIKKNMYKKAPVFKNETSLATLRKMQIYRINHGIY